MKDIYKKEGYRRQDPLQVNNKITEWEKVNWAKDCQKHHGKGEMGPEGHEERWPSSD
jgi:hypothetical protein